MKYVALILKSARRSKRRTILTIVQSLAGHPDARAACRAAGVQPGGERPYLHALEVLAGSNMLVTKEHA